MTGKVYLVGAGPGDPELITVRGKRLLALADSILYDHLANPALLHEARPGAERLYVGKKRSNHAFSQTEIIELMISRAAQGRTVVRLKGGDPFIFGRGGEEVEGLAEAGIEFEVVPGVTAPLGIAACTGVPLTHREHTSVVTFVTGHDVAAIDWSKTGLADTLVIFMGLHHLRDIVNAVMVAGRPPDTPAMAVRWGTRPDQKTISGTLADLPKLADDARLAPPATIVVGEVVRLRQKLDWFERRPLFGQRVIVTRSRQQSGELAQLLAQLGAEPLELPVIELAPMDDYAALDASLGQLAEYGWVIFTSTNAVAFFMERLREKGLDSRAIRGRVCAIGLATSEALGEHGIRADLVPADATSEGVADVFSGEGLAGVRVLLPRAAAAREVIPAALTAQGARVDVVDTYQNRIPRDAESCIREYLTIGRRADWITFTSGSTVKNWLALAGRDSLEGVKIASIGPATSDVARRHGLRVDAEAQPHTVEGLAEVIKNF